MSNKERFLKKVKKTDSCWIWIGAKYYNGYGAFYWGGGAKHRRNTGAHRASYLLFVDEIPIGLDVLHKCDNPSCVNPEHLFVGTHIDNMHDKHKKGRANIAIGERHGHAKATEEIVRGIRNDIRTNVEIAKQVGLAANTVSYIRAGRTWKHV